MANRTQINRNIHGTNPQYLIDQIIRNKIYQSLYWKEELFALTSATLIEKAHQLSHIGGCYGCYSKPSRFLQLLLKMLQIQPEMDIVLYLIQQNEYKYITALGMLYLRVVAHSQEDIYRVLEVYYMDYRKLRFRGSDGSYSIVYMD